MQPRSRMLAGATLLAVAIGACSTGGTTGGATTAPTSAPPAATPAMSDHMMSQAPAATPGASTAAPMTDGGAADLRTTLDLALGEHIILASKATGAALGGRNDEFAAYGGLLNSNGTEIGDVIGAAYGDEAKDQFNQIWSAHNGFFVDYTTGVATDDKAKTDKAVDDLTTIYVPDFSAFIAGATGLPEDAVAQLTTDHVLQTKAIVDAQAAKDWDAAYAAIREAYAHMAMIGDAIAPAVAAKFPDKFSGEPTSKAVDLRVGLNQLLQEHLYLASFATDAALDGRNDEFAAAGGALNTNGTDLGSAIGGLYGDAAKDEWNRIWSAHNGFFVDYTTGVATDDMAVMDKAVEDLTTVYVPEFAEFLAGATGLPKDALAELITEHVLTTKAVVDAQAGDDEEAAAKADLEAGRHMAMLGDPLAKAIVAKLPDMFR